MRHQDSARWLSTIVVWPRTIHKINLGGSGDDWAPSRHFSRHSWFSKLCFSLLSDIIGCDLRSILSYGSILEEDNEKKPKLRKGLARLKSSLGKNMSRNISRPQRQLGLLTVSLELAQKSSLSCETRFRLHTQFPKEFKATKK